MQPDADFVMGEGGHLSSHDYINVKMLHLLCYLFLNSHHCIVVTSAILFGLVWLTDKLNSD